MGLFDKFKPKSEAEQSQRRMAEEARRRSNFAKQQNRLSFQLASEQRKAALAEQQTEIMKARQRQAVARPVPQYGFGGQPVPRPQVQAPQPRPYDFTVPNFSSGLFGAKKKRG